MAEKPDVIVVGAGVMGCSAAYWLSKEGLKVLLLEKEAVGAGASGMAPAHWLAFGRGAREVLEDERLSELGEQGFQLHQELASTLPQESGIDIGYREHPAIYLAFSREAMESWKAQLSSLQCDAATLRWLDGQPLWELEPRVNRDALGGLVCRKAQVMAYRFALALLKAAERHGAELRHGEVVGLKSKRRQVTGAHLKTGEIVASETVVLTMGPWSHRAANWLELRIPVYPVRGQLLELRVPHPQLQASLAYDEMYLVHKPDGTTLAGTTYEPGSGFNDHPTAAGFESIMTATLQIAPSLEEAQVTNHLSGLRPASEDSLPLIGPVPGWNGVYIVSGHDRRGMGLSLVSTRIIADLIVRGRSPLSVNMFDPGRFGSIE